MNARDRILTRLRSGGLGAIPPRPEWQPPAYGAARKDRFKAMLEASHADVHEVDDDTWPQRLQAILANKGVARMLYAPTTEAGAKLADAWAGGAAPQLVPYDQTVEHMKPVLVHEVDAALTTAKGGIAQTGSLILWPTPDEPRLMSLLPPIHVVLVREADLTDSLAQTIAAQGWSSGMPTNVVLVSGPSKTADIEQTLAYGVHGPKELIVLLVAEGAS
jgi:L-lactate dehydrogenase complex protein LldG